MYTPAPGRPMCRFGSTCWRTNPGHFEEANHPDDHPLLIGALPPAQRAVLALMRPPAAAGGYMTPPTQPAPTTPERAAVAALVDAVGEQWSKDCADGYATPATTESATQAKVLRARPYPYLPVLCGVYFS